MKKKAIAVIVSIALLLLVSAPVSAHSIIPGKYTKWAITMYDPLVSHRVALLKSNGDYLNVNWKQKLTTAISNWNTYSNSYVAIAATSFSISNVDLATYTTWPIFLPSDGVAITFCRDISGVWMYDMNTGIYNPNCGTYYNYVQIYTNPAMNSDAVFAVQRKVKSLTHEIGHALQLGHPGESDISVLRQGSPLPRSNWDRPQSHDRTDLSVLYFN